LLTNNPPPLCFAADVDADGVALFGSFWTHFADAPFFADRVSTSVPSIAWRIRFIVPGETVAGSWVAIFVASQARSGNLTRNNEKLEPCAFLKISRRWILGHDLNSFAYFEDKLFALSIDLIRSNLWLYDAAEWLDSLI
jgi:hypothetical protein